MGDEFVMMDMSFLTKKPPFDEFEPNKISNSEYKKMKERRKAIQDGAPAELISKLNAKLKAAGRAEVTKVSVPEECYWYQHEKGVSDKDFFAGGSTILVDGIKVDHTLYRAFLIRHYNSEEKSFYIQSELSEDWKWFRKMI